MIKVFNFVCQDCGHKAEYFFKEEEGEPPCKACESTNNQRRISATNGFVDKSPYERYSKYL